LHDKIEIDDLTKKRSNEIFGCQTGVLNSFQSCKISQ